jgi:hypothetical protein
MAATVVIPPVTGKAIEMLVNCFRGGLIPPERTVISPTPFPAIEQLAATRAKSRAIGK